MNNVGTNPTGVFHFDLAEILALFGVEHFVLLSQNFSNPGIRQGGIPNA